MTEIEKKQIRKMRLDGLGYKKIANELCISINTIKSFCRSHNLTSTGECKRYYCKECKKEIHQMNKHKTKIFCCDACRMKWWNKHKQEINRKKAIVKTCPVCQKSYLSYPNENRKYCSHDCYIKARFKDGLRAK